ncbi:MarR family transcriptional regulator [Actinomadura logoneensis]|uniref:MarR family transcriptional regulator n=1 Tax=Actinomadura logoneensis TaxID=2293572 RepID=A0A372JS24_9ACTN|nr:MarR family transcriptional regulator [Actinomadura logoneensis]RFU42564.1 MarR family transcriptional regulator [Actinomadura logoneensis]
MNDTVQDVRTHRPIGYWLRHIDRALEADLGGLLAAEGLTRRGWQVLNSVSYEPVTIAALDKTLDAFVSPDEPTMRPQVERLVELGWARLTGDTAELTEEGVRAHRRVREAIAARRARMVECFTPEEFRSLNEMLRRFAEHLATL